MMGWNIVSFHIGRTIFRKDKERAADIMMLNYDIGWNIVSFHIGTTIFRKDKERAADIMMLHYDGLEHCIISYRKNYLQKG